MENAKILKHIIEERRSVFPKSYTGGEISREVIEEVLSAAVLAPNHKKTKPWRFKVFIGEEKHQLGVELQTRYKETTPEKDFLPKKYDAILTKITQASAVITTVVEFSGKVPEWEEIAAVAMAVENMYLTCTAHRVGCYWSSAKWAGYLSESLKIEDQQRCLGIFYMGTTE